MAFMSQKTIIPIMLIIANAVFATNYCDPSLCSGKHIGCGNNLAFSATCQNPKDVRLTDKLKQLIVNAHNDKRNIIAGGGSNSLRPACRMATMQWDNELAALAELNVRQCQMKHDCHNTDTFKYSGQNLAWITYYDSPDVAKLAEKSVDMWYNELKNTKMSYIESYPSNYNGPTIGHFTVMMADKNIRVGCAASTYAVSNASYRAFLFACNYATTNMINFPIYKDCKTAATECTTGRNPSFQNLCSTSEIYNVNKFY